MGMLLSEPFTVDRVLLRPVELRNAVWNAVGSRN
jgi:hypothetical protein